MRRGRIDIVAAKKTAKTRRATPSRRVQRGTSRDGNASLPLAIPPAPIHPWFALASAHAKLNPLLLDEAKPAEAIEDAQSILMLLMASFGTDDDIGNVAKRLRREFAKKARAKLTTSHEANGVPYKWDVAGVEPRLEASTHADLVAASVAWLEDPKAPRDDNALATHLLGLLRWLRPSPIQEHMARRWGKASLDRKDVEDLRRRFERMREHDERLDARRAVIAALAVVKYPKPANVFSRLDYRPPKRPG